VSRRIIGELVTWNDDRGFGFLEPGQVFLHVSSVRGRRPAVGEVLTFVLTSGEDGRPRAADARRPAEVRPGLTGIVDWSIVVVVGLVAVAGLASSTIPPLIGAWYASGSALCFVVYVVDKRAASAGRRRVAESTLLVLGLVGGWPGGLLAQRLFRHKTRKRSFRTAFWITVVVNMSALAVVVWSLAVEAGRLPLLGSFSN